jgi:hypothetical protein
MYSNVGVKRTSSRASVPARTPRTLSRMARWVDFWASSNSQGKVTGEAFCSEGVEAGVRAIAGVVERVESVGFEIVVEVWEDISGRVDV